ncbi:hypothetical protein GQ43DRAFT_443243 [Delitschia confertaspora ATCC 74209]|uniref:Rhodopsin domain-containing protein n=1 Tax=Delitschia confertaspora ATCC 74209 TaxID=1513339 RepID=A0A9P4JLA3_9PLEO|nr:hypothetical protein GQ43DRAFT_443243 [Delitschia confertaspora ATCC 74209]
MGSAGSVPAVYDKPARSVLWMLVTVTSLAVASRLLSRRIQRAKLALDDYLTVVAYVINLGELVTGLLEVSHGATSLPRLAKMNLEEKLYLKNVTIALGILYSLAILSIKISVLFMYRRIFTLNSRTFRIGWWANLLFLIPCWTVLVFTFLGMQVSPRRTSFGYDKLSKVGSPLVGALNALSDLTVLLLPIGIVWKLTLPRREKAAVMGLFSLGMLGTAISIMRAARFNVRNVHHWNAAYAFYNDMILTTTETSVGLLCTCLTVIKPLVRKTRDIAIYSTTQFSDLLSLRSKRSKGSVNSGSVRSRNSQGSYFRSGEGIKQTRQFDVDTVALASTDSHNIALDPLRAWEDDEPPVERGRVRHY